MCYCNSKNLYNPINEDIKYKVLNQDKFIKNKIDLKNIFICE